MRAVLCAQWPVFPISHLPYPPFRLHIEAAPHAVPDLYVDGKVLALKLVAQGICEVSGRVLDGKVVADLESYLKRCKLGTQQLGRALALAGMLGSLDPETRQHRAVMHEFLEIRAWAEGKLKALQRVQDDRLCRLSARERQKRGFNIGKALEVLQTLEDEPGRGAPSKNRVTRSLPATWRAMAAARSRNEALGTLPSHAPRTVQDSTPYAFAERPVAVISLHGELIFSL